MIPPEHYKEILCIWPDDGGGSESKEIQMQLTS